jgi:hypothetical protein
MTKRNGLDIATHAQKPLAVVKPETQQTDFSEYVKYIYMYKISDRVTDANEEK